MKYADRLELVAQRCERRGITVVRVPGWRDRGRMKNGKPQDMISIESLTIHHTATGGTKDYASLNLVTNGRSDLAGPLCNWGAGRAGTLFLVSAGSANHTGATRELWQSNQYASGLEAENNGIGEPWTLPLKVAMTIWAQEMRKEFKVPAARVLGHREICDPVGRKPDPNNFDMYAFRIASQYPQEDDMTPDERQMLIDIHNVLIGDQSVGSKQDGTRMPWRTMLEWVDLHVNEIHAAIGAKSLK